MLVVRKPSRETDLGRKSFVPCDRRGSGLHISEIRRRAENPLAAKKQCVRYSHPIVSQNQTKSDGAKTPVCISNRKKSKCHLSRCVTNSYVDMRMRQPDSSAMEYSTQAMAVSIPVLFLLIPGGKLHKIPATAQGTQAVVAPVKEDPPRNVRQRTHFSPTTISARDSLYSY